MLPVMIEAELADVAEVVGDVLLVTAGAAGTGLLLTVGGVWYAVRRIRRSRSIRRRIESGGLAFRSLSTDASTRHLARRRLEITRSLEATARTLEAARREKRPLGQLLYIAADLEAVGTSLNDRLRVAEVEPSTEARASMASSLDGHVQTFLRLSADLRAAGLTGTEDIGVDRLRTIAGQLDIEVAAMGAWHETYRGALGADRTADPLDHLRGTAPGGSTRIERDADPDLPRTAYPEGRH